MKLVKYFRNMLSNLYLSIKRFPFTILLSVSILALLISIHELSPIENTLSRIAMVLSLGIPLSLFIKLFFEKRNEENTYKLFIGYGASALLLVLYYLFLLPNAMGMVPTTRYIAVNLALYMGFLFIPYFPEKPDFEMYVIVLVSAFFTTLLYSVVLYAGLSAILFSIDKLLGIKVLGKVYYYTWLFVVFIFAVSYFLSVIPLKDSKLTLKSYPKLLRILILYIVMPLLTAYTIILYIYFGKIIVTVTWPIGLVSHLVLWYSVIVTIALFFITPIKDESSWANKFLKLAPKILLPLIVMMFISMGIRINAYGITEPRYFVVILGLWIFSVMIYFSFSKKLRNILIPVSLAFITLISVFGPVSSYSLSKYSQRHRFEKILMQNNMLTDGNINTSKNVSKEDKANISSILSYFHRNHSYKDLKHLPENFKLKDMDKVFGFSYEGPFNESPDQYFYIRSRSQGVLDIKGYDYIFDMNGLYDRDILSFKDIDAIYDLGSSTIKMTYLGNEIYKKNLEDFANNLVSKYNTSDKEIRVPENEMAFIEENDKIKVKIVFQHISGSKNDSIGEINSKGFEFYLLVKVK
ncbi:DUF4153 domain-containing protein [uncultured Clostridium sp.]|uniref:DUF4153 domain-containing protein n=1 Tax=uncultured Clostridium sp. TaxID=59620 RepID=UPI0028E7A4A5|nr:DUF4153 domain-containing protein [uncultured Clostridium sp.]